MNSASWPARCSAPDPRQRSTSLRAQQAVARRAGGDVRAPASSSTPVLSRPGRRTRMPMSRAVGRLPAAVEDLVGWRRRRRSAFQYGGVGAVRPHVMPWPTNTQVGRVALSAMQSSPPAGRVPARHPSFTGRLRSRLLHHMTASSRHAFQQRHPPPCSRSAPLADLAPPSTAQADATGIRIPIQFLARNLVPPVEIHHLKKPSQPISLP